MNIAAVILAAGRSHRFGDNDKRLALIEGEPLLRRVVVRVAASAVSSVTVVTAPASEENSDVLQLLTDLPVSQISNSNFADGMGTSISAGIAALDPTVDAALIVPADMPEISPELIDLLIAAFEGPQAGQIIVPVDPQGRQRNPVLWPKPWFFALKKLAGGAGGKGLIAANRDAVQTVLWENTAVFHDIDTREEFTSYITARFQSKS